MLAEVSLPEYKKLPHISEFGTVQSTFRYSAPTTNCCTLPLTATFRLVGLAIGTFLVATGHVALNTAYALVDAVYESLNTATGLSFLFSLLSLAALMPYIRRRYRFALVGFAK